MPWELWVKILHFALSKDRYFLCFYINFTPSVVLLSLTWTVIVFKSLIKTCADTSKNFWCLLSKNHLICKVDIPGHDVTIWLRTQMNWWLWLICVLTFETNGFLFLNADILALWRNNWPACTWGHSLSPTSPKSMCTSLHRRQPRMEEGHLASTVQTCCLGLVTISTQFCQLLTIKVCL